MANTTVTEMVENYRNAKKSLCFLDCNRWILQSAQDMLYPIIGIEPHTSEMNKQSIEKAVVSNMQCLEYDPTVGNEQLITLIKPYDQLYGSIVWAPELAYTKNEIDSYLRLMIESKVVCVRMFPKKLNHSMKKWQIGTVLEIMERKRIPLMIWHTETSWDTINEICEEYPNLPVIVEGNGQKLLYHNRNFISLLKRHKNLYVESHDLIQQEIIEQLVLVEHIDRLLFGTYYPYNDPDSSMMMITNANIPEQSRHNISGNHMRQLISNIRRSE